ncbi:MAG: ATP-binding protein [Bacteroidota bacterium]
MWENIHINRLAYSFLPDDTKNIIVLLTGARQTGKTTLLKKRYSRLPYYNLDAIEYREQLKDISSFSWVNEVGEAVIDEIQKEPGLLDKIKYSFDDGSLRFSALSGSARLLLLRQIRETLTGRVTVQELFPLIMNELMNFDSSAYEPVLLHRLFDTPDPEKYLASLNSVLLGMLWDKAFRTEEYLMKWGGMPALLHISGESEKQRWLQDYSVTYLERDLNDLARISDLMPFHKFQQIASLRAGNLLSYSEIARDAGIGIETARRYLEYLRISYQAILIQPYRKNLTSSLVKTPKVYWLDNGLLRQISGLGFSLSDGRLYENYFAAELYKYIKSVRKNITLSFYRTRSGMEVDFCLESANKLIAIEVKDRSTVVRTDITGLKKIRDAAGRDFRIGLLAYRGNAIKKLSDRIWAVPSCRLFIQ